jgi:hypothetical protein
MGEIVDLERYRKQRRRRASVSAGADSRDHAEPKGKRPRPIIEPIETARAEMDPTPKINRDDQEAD